MKRFILLLGFLFLGLTSVSGQNYQQRNTRNYIDWTIENPNEWGSFYWSVTQQWNGKMYIYQVFLFSNSYFQSKRDGTNHEKATTYIRNLTVSMHEADPRNGVVYNVVHVPIAVATADYTLGKPIAHFWSNSKQCHFQLTYEAISPFDYSRY